MQTNANHTGNQQVQKITLLPQTRVHTGNAPADRGNGYPAVIASLMGLSSAESAFQVQEHYDQDQASDPLNWNNRLDTWLASQGYKRLFMMGHQSGNQPYIVIGQAEQGGYHTCVYQNGQLVHDPHPEGRGLITEEFYEVITPIA